MCLWATETLTFQVLIPIKIAVQVHLLMFYAYNNDQDQKI